MVQTASFKLYQQKGDSRRFSLEYTNVADLFVGLGRKLETFGSLKTSDIFWLDPEEDFVVLDDADDLQEALKISNNDVKLIHFKKGARRRRVSSSSSSSSSSSTSSSDDVDVADLVNAHRRRADCGRNRRRMHCRRRRDCRGGNRIRSLSAQRTRRDRSRSRSRGPRDRQPSRGRNVDADVEVLMEVPPRGRGGFPFGRFGNEFGRGGFGHGPFGGRGGFGRGRGGFGRGGFGCGHPMGF